MVSSWYWPNTIIIYLATAITYFHLRIIFWAYRINMASVMMWVDSGHGYGLDPLYWRQHCPLTIIWKTQQCMTILSIYTGCKAQYFCHRQQVKSMQCSQAPREVFVSSWFDLTHYSASHLWFRWGDWRQIPAPHSSTAPPPWVHLESSLT